MPNLTPRQTFASFLGITLSIAVVGCKVRAGIGVIPPPETAESAAAAGPNVRVSPNGIATGEAPRVGAAAPASANGAPDATGVLQAEGSSARPARHHNGSTRRGLAKLRRERNDCERDDGISGGRHVHQHGEVPIRWRYDAGRNLYGARTISDDCAKETKRAQL